MTAPIDLGRLGITTPMREECCARCGDELIELREYGIVHWAQLVFRLCYRCAFIVSLEGPYKPVEPRG